jgi:hypothetical protein
VLHAFSFAFSAGDSLTFALPWGASPDTACLCSAYSSSLSRFWLFNFCVGDGLGCLS